MAKLTREQQKAMFAKNAIKELGKFGQHSPIFEQEINKLGMDDAHRLVGSFGTKSDRVVKQNLTNFISDKFSENIIREKEKRLKGLSEGERSVVEDNIESDIRHELKQSGFPV